MDIVDKIAKVDTDMNDRPIEPVIIFLLFLLYFYSLKEKRL